MRNVWLLALVVSALALLSAMPAQALTEQELDRQVQKITGELRCPTCQGLSVRDSDAPFSRQMTEKVRSMLKEGQTEEQIKAYFVSRYGEWILRAPKKEGLGLVLWVAPGVALIAVGGLVLYRVRRTSAHQEREDEELRQKSLNEEQRSRIQRDLRRFEEGE